MSQYDLQSAKQHYEQDSFIGFEFIPSEFKQVVEETFKTGKAVEPPKLEPEASATKPKTPRTKVKGEKEDEDEMAETPRPKKSRAKKIDEEVEDAAAPKPKRTRKKRAFDEVDTSEEEYMPKKTKSRQAPMEEVDPAVAKIQALAEEMRDKAAK